MTEYSVVPVTEEAVLENLSRSLSRHFGGLTVLLLPKTTTSVTFEARRDDGPTLHLVVSDSFIAGCANQGRMMCESDDDLRRAFDEMVKAPTGKAVFIAGDSELSLVDV